MSVIYILIPLAIVIILVAVSVFFWAVKSDQFNDLDRQGYSILFDDDTRPAENKPTTITPKITPKIAPKITPELNQSCPEDPAKDTTPTSQQ